MSRRAIGAFFLGLLGAATIAHGETPRVVGSPPTHAGATLPSGGGQDVAPWLLHGDWFGPATPGATRREWQKRKSPRVAMISSFVFPGLGQMYNEREFWAVVVAGVEFYFIGDWIAEQRLTNRYRAIVNADPGNQEAEVLFVLHRDNRIQSTWLLGLTILLSGVQSYVDAHLFDFDATPPTVRFAPSFTGEPSAGVQLRF